MKIELVFVVFALLGALDKIFGNRFKLGSAFEKGIMTSGALIISMSGMIVLSPVMAEIFSSLLGPFFQALSIDPSAVAAFFPVDAGGASIAYELSDNAQIRAYNGIVVASMFGATLCPVIPMSLQMVNVKYHDDVLIGLLCGFATIPIGCITAGLLMGCPVMDLLLNTVFIIIISAVICIGLWKYPRISQKIFGIFGSLLMIFVTIGLCFGIIDQLLGIKLIPGIAPVSESFTIIGNIAIILAGVFPLLEIISRIFRKPLIRIGKAMGLDESSVLGLVTTLANSVPVFSMMENMSKKGRILNMAFSVSAGYIIGDHLAFVLSFDRAYALPMVVGKLVSGVLALALASVIYRRSYS